MRIFKKSDIIDVEALDKTLAVLPFSCFLDASGLVTATGPDDNPNVARQILVAALKDVLTKGRARLHQHHLGGASGSSIVQGHAYLMDVILHHLYQLIHQGREEGKGSFSLIATGGYGRGELAPFSDIDLLFLLPEGVSVGRQKGEGVFPVSAGASGAPAVVGASSTTPAQHPLTQRVEHMLYCLWDMGLDVGHAVRTLGECVQLARQNVEIRTSLLESRFLSGDRTLFDLYHDTLFAKVLERGPEAFMRAKLVEQTKRHERFGNSLFYLEPNVKENPGGLRDLQTFSWISKYRYQVKKVQELVSRELITQEEYNAFVRCQSFLTRVRNALHYRAGRREDRLTFQHQVDIAAEFGYKDRPVLRGVEQFMRRYYKVSRQVGNLSWIFLRKYQEEHRRLHWWNRRTLEGEFQLHGDKVTVTNPEFFKEDSVNLFRLFDVGQRHLKSIHPETMRLVGQDLGLIDRSFRKNPSVAALFLKMLNGERAVAWVLRRMSISGVLGRYIPEFGRIVGLPQYDLFHVYTVDEHTIRAVEALRHIKAGRFSDELPICTALMGQLKFYEKGSIMLYLAVLLHDIAKGLTGDHQLKGALISRKICLRLGLSESETGTVSWLVGRHLLFSRTALRRDISDPDTVTHFARQVGDQRRLESLLLLTVADIRAVGPGTWNLWKADLLRRLYHMAQHVLKKGAFRPEELIQQAEAKKEVVLRLLGVKSGVPRVRRHLARFESDYFVRHDAATIARHTLALLGKASEHGQARHYEKIGPRDPVSCVEIVFLPSPVSDTTELLVHTHDQPGLMARISGALAMRGVNILSADVTTTTDGMALDVFVVQGTMGKAIEDASQLNQLEHSLRQVLTERFFPQPVWVDDNAEGRRRQTFDIPVTIETDDTLDAFTILEITSLDRMGLLFAITREIERHAIQIRMAKITTYGERAVDVFYVRDLYGLKLVAKKIASLEKGLRGALGVKDASVSSVGVCVPTGVDSSRVT